MRGSVRGVERAIAAWQSRPHDARPLLLLDFDGTLVDFDIDPGVVVLPESRQRLLQMLAQRADLSAGIISGRRISDLRERIPVAGSLFMAGLHGLEIEGPDLRFTHHAAALAAPAIGVLTGELQEAVKSLPGVHIEDKTLSVVLHVRGASRADRMHAISRFTALAEPWLANGTLRLLTGDHIFELLPNIDWGKGDAVRAIIGHVESATREPVWPVYLGDDHTDEDAFEEIGTKGLTIAVTRRTVGALFQIDDPDGVECFLRAILTTE